MAEEKIELIAYSTDASMIRGNATMVIFPKSAEEIVEIVKSSAGITVRGGGSGLVGGAVPQNCPVVDLSKMNKIIEFDINRKTIIVESGIILDELNNFLEKYNLEFSVNPSSHSICTIGGMIATNAVGNRAVKYGRTSNWVEKIWVVNGKGEFSEIGKADLGDFAGLEGITGVIVKAKLKLAEKKERTATLFSFDSLEEVQDAVLKLKLESDISAIEFFDKLSSSILGLRNSYHLIAEYENNFGKVKGRDYEKLMGIRDSAYPSLASLGYVHIEDPKIMIGKFAEFAEFLEEKKIPFFGHLGVGIIHPCFMKGENEKINKTIKLAKRLHGQVSGEHGIGLMKKEFLEQSEIKLIERIKNRHDPLNKINCGKVIDSNSGGMLK